MPVTRSDLRKEYEQNHKNVKVRSIAYVMKLLHLIITETQHIRWILPIEHIGINHS